MSSEHDLPAKAQRLSGVVLLLIATLVAIGFAQDFQRLSPELPFGAVDQPEAGFFLKDFVVHHGVARAAWTGELPRPYQLAGQEAYWRATWPALPLAKPSAYAPTWHWVAAPALALPLPAGFGVWLLLSLAALAWLWWRVLAPSVQSPAQLWLLLAVTASLDVLLGFKEGQTTLVTTAALGGIWFYGCRLDAPANWSRHLLLALLFVVTTIKPGLGLIGLALLLGQRRWIAAALGMGLALGWAAALTPVLGGTGWVADYVELLRHYRWEHLSPFMCPSMEPTTGTSLSVLANALGLVPSPVVFSALSAASLAAMAGCLAARWLGWLSARGFTQVLLLSYLLLAPHLTCTEDFLLIVVIAAGGWWQQAAHATLKLLGVLVVVNLGPEVWWEHANLVAAAAKLLLAFWFVTSLRRRSRQTAC